MKHLLLIMLAITLLSLAADCQVRNSVNIVSYTVDPGKQNVGVYWKNDSLNLIRSFGRLKVFLSRSGQRLLFAMNAGMFHPDRTPVGLYIYKGKQLSPINNLVGQPDQNFYKGRKGVFYLNFSKQAFLVLSTEKMDFSKMEYATQSGPMLVHNGVIEPFCQPGSTNLNIRNGVGVLTDGRVIFAISRQPVNFYALADYFKKMGCREALYLDGYVSRAYFSNEHLDGTDQDFGPIIGVSTK